MILSSLAMMELDLVRLWPRHARIYPQEPLFTWKQTLKEENPRRNGKWIYQESWLFLMVGVEIHLIYTKRRKPKEVKLSLSAYSNYSRIPCIEDKTRFTDEEEAKKSLVNLKQEIITYFATDIERQRIW
ncbi:hypothetical protein, partial [Ammoniphilus sp. 3BR4]|uniref:hypothetical protein n=1 Tax=Ammoniphilus sp. 3BR4 TaxID=3158265 RepID=UPI003465A75C